ncbi:MAG: hypothetical protein AAGI66_00605 [Cyanobacteria bacterium P01_H01_bin.74]
MTSSVQNTSGLLIEKINQLACFKSILHSQAAMLEGEFSGLEETVDRIGLAYLRQMLAALPVSQRDCIHFGFSNSNLIAVLNHEFDCILPCNTQQQVLLFKKITLDAKSVWLAGSAYAGFTLGFNNNTMEESTSYQLIYTEIKHFSEWLFDASRQLYKESLDETKQQKICAEYAAGILIYLNKKCKSLIEAHTFLNTMTQSEEMIRAHCHDLTADALFKYDACRLLFGEQAPYTQAWFRKTLFRNMIAKRVNAYLAAAS